ncbi:MAG: hypothetical protein IT454_08930 [Planctomycetes bacterium]|nr:hypothetical protein [Planctomycetota bacterium]
MSAHLAARERVLVRVPDWLGDLVMAEPALRGVHERVRELDGELTLAGIPHLLELFDGVFEGARRVDARDTRAWRGHDLALLLTNSFRSAWQAWTAGIPRRIGAARDARGWLLTHAVTPALERGRAPLGIGRVGRGARYLPRPFGASCIELAHWAGCTVRDPRPRLVVARDAQRAAEARLAAFGLSRDAAFVLANVGGRAGGAKSLSSTIWGHALAGLAQPVVLVAGPGEEAALDEVRALAPRAHACAAPLAGLRELAALSSLARVVATTDSGPRHVANAVGAALVVVFGPTDPRHTADHTQSTTALRVPLECGPCHRERCELTGDAHMRCMRAISPEALRAAIEARLVHAERVATA